jgi:hypothetical protein
MKTCADAQKVIAETWHSALKVSAKRPANEELVEMPSFLDAFKSSVPAAGKSKKQKVKSDLPYELTSYTIFCKTLRDEGNVPKDNQASYLGEQWKKLNDEEKKVC